MQSLCTVQDTPERVTAQCETARLAEYWLLDHISRGHAVNTEIIDVTPFDRERHLARERCFFPAAQDRNLRRQKEDELFDELVVLSDE